VPILSGQFSQASFPGALFYVDSVTEIRRTERTRPTHWDRFGPS